MTIDIDPAVTVPGYLMPFIIGLAAKMKRPGVAPIHGHALFLHRKPTGVFWLTTDADGAQYAAQQQDYSWAAKLWSELMAGADTPALRLALATGMVPRLPCGECRRNWREALRGLTDADTATPEAWRRWVWGHRQAIARSKGKEEWPFPG